MGSYILLLLFSLYLRILIIFYHKRMTKKMEKENIFIKINKKYMMVQNLIINFVYIIIYTIIFTRSMNEWLKIRLWGVSIFIRYQI